MPSNEGRGYVLRRILRRAVRYGRQMLGADEGFFAALVPGAIASLAEAFPELPAQQKHVQEVIADEEAAFSSMLSRGIKEFNARAEAIKASGKAGFDGQAALANPHPHPDPNPNPNPIPNAYPLPNPNRDPSPSPIPNRSSSPNPKPGPTPGQAA